MILVDKISLKYDNQPLFDKLSFSVPDTTMVSIIGESGKGKTTLLNLLAGFEIVESGNILYDNIELNSKNLSKIRQKIAWLPQNFNVPFDTVEELFFSVFELKINKSYKPSSTSIENIFDKLALDITLLKKNIDEISGGQKQRIILASLLLTQKKYFLLDEPTSALDSFSAQKLINVLKESDKTVLIATHDDFVVKNSDTTINLDVL
jgi:polar amino acid transport system ATP-binding protein/putative ABC transport system ATP-binding protein